LNQYWTLTVQATEEEEGRRWLVETKEELFLYVKECINLGQSFQVAPVEMTEEDFNNVPEM
jgi:hypothetical protein